ncbi:hypothetical protein [Candidatus Frankia nodulisporulans]|uniref:hypothetical protein n=1 Tax=Candidatus Frankia nodulisporulans TaxID=2060052 RepID=UPI0013D74D96|nr:hypothetical protein [Candidatus Frankia nodulisporulans]
MTAITSAAGVWIVSTTLLACAVASLPPSKLSLGMVGITLSCNLVLVAALLTMPIGAA